MVEFAYGTIRAEVAAYLQQQQYDHANRLLGELLPRQAQMGRASALTKQQAQSQHAELVWTRYMFGVVALHEAATSGDPGARQAHRMLAAAVGRALVSAGQRHWDNLNMVERATHAEPYKTALRERALGCLTLARALSQEAMCGQDDLRVAEDKSLAMAYYAQAHKTAKQLADLEGRMLEVEIAAAAAYSGFDRGEWAERLGWSLVTAGIEHRDLPDFDREAIMGPEQIASQYAPRFALQPAQGN